MPEQRERRAGLSPIVPFFIGGAIAGGIAMMFAPQLTRARDAVCAAGRRTRELMHKRHPEAMPEENNYSAVPEGAENPF